MKKDVILFLKKILIFSIPFAIFFCFPIIVLLFSKELVSVDSVIKKQSDEKELILFGLAYSNPDKYYKYNSAIERKPEVLTLGTSRVMPFRSKLFKKDTFYNAGGGVEKIGQFSYFLDNIPKETQPKILIIGLDQYFFNPNWDNSSADEDNIKEAIINDNHALNAIKASFTGTQIFKDYFDKKFNFSDLIHNNNSVGLNAIKNGNAFRNDGSYYYGKIMGDPNSNKEARFKDSFERISSGGYRFEYGKDISEDSIKKLEKFLEKCKNRNIHVIGFMPPYAHVVYEKMKQSEEKYAYVFRLESLLKPLFEKNNFDFYNFSDIASLGASDEETIDGFHGSEKAYTRLFIKIAENNLKLKAYSENLDILKKRLSDSKNDLVIFENNEY